MNTVKVEMEVPKELKEVVDALDAVLEKVLAKADIAEYLTLVGTLSAAADGVDQLGDELKSEHRHAAVAYLTERISTRLWKSKAE